MLVLAVNCPIVALSVVPSAQLTSQLQFGTVAKIGIWTSTAQVALGPLFAFLGLGAYSFVLPRPIGAAAQALWMWIEAKPRIRFRPQFRRWRVLAGDSGYNLIALFAALIVSNGDYFVLSQFGSATALGLYYFAFNLSLQTVTLLLVNLWGVLLPTLAKLRDDPVRQTNAFLRAARLLAIISTPLSLLQAAVAAPLIHLLFPPQWYPAIPVLQVLSIGLAFQVVGAASQSLFQAQGRFGIQMWCALASALVFSCFTLIGGAVGGITAMATVVGIYYALAGPVNIYVAVRGRGGMLRDAVMVFIRPMLAGLTAAGIGRLAALTVPATSFVDHIQVIVTTVITVALYIPLIVCLAPQDWADLKSRITELPGTSGIRAVIRRFVAFA
jgi:PST family polysaccharide transporter